MMLEVNEGRESGMNERLTRANKAEEPRRNRYRDIRGRRWTAIIPPRISEKERRMFEVDQRRGRRRDEIQRDKGCAER